MPPGRASARSWRSRRRVTRCSPIELRSLVLLIASTLLPSVVVAQDTSHLGDDVRDLFVSRCASCHGEAVRKPKGRFGFVEDLERVTETYVVRGSPDDSDLWILTTDPDAPMPPLEADVPQLTLSELALIRWWIADGAKPPTARSTPSKTKAAAAPEDPAPAEGVVGDEKPPVQGGLRRRIARAHPLVIHFPIALLMVAALAELLGIRTDGERWRPVVGFCLVIGAAGCAMAVWSGWWLAPAEGFSDDTVFAHRWLGVAAACGAFVAVLLHFRFPARFLVLYRVVLIATAIAVAAAGHHGGLLVYGDDYFA